MAQNVKAKACTAFEIAVETVENVSFRQSLTVRGETMQITHMPRDIVSAYDEAKKSSGPLAANEPFVFELDVQFDVRILSEPTGLRVPAASIGASQLPQAGQEGATVQKFPTLDRKIRDM